MPDLREQLEQLLRERVCLVGLGNVEYGDDGVGVRLVERLERDDALGSCGNIQHPTSNIQRPMNGKGTTVGCSMLDVECWMFSTSATLLGCSLINAGTTPERFIGRIADQDFDHIIFLDAVEFSGAPGSVVFLNSDQMAARFPQVSTHKLSLGLLARQLEANGRTKAWLLGVQPQWLSAFRTQSGTGLPHSKTQALSSAGPVSEGLGVRQSCAAFGSAAGVAHRAPLSPAVQTTLELLVVLLRDCLEGGSRREEALDLSLVTSAATTKMEVLA
jgi:hydrogenase maturation protease